MWAGSFLRAWLVVLILFILRPPKIDPLLCLLGLRRVLIILAETRRGIPDFCT